MKEDEHEEIGEDASGRKIKEMEKKSKKGRTIPTKSERRCDVLSPFAAEKRIYDCLSHFCEEVRYGDAQCKLDFSTGLLGCKREGLYNDTRMRIVAIGYPVAGHYYISIISSAF